MARRSFEMTTLHATCVAFDGAAILLRGPSGSGKSDLALRLIDAGARLVADDYVDLSVEGGGRLVARPPERLAGLIEVRGLGVLRVDYAPAAEVRLLADLVAPEAVERMPKPECESLMGLSTPRLRVAPFEASAPAKLRRALAVALDPSLRLS